MEMSTKVAPPALAALGFMKLKKHCESLDFSKDDIAQCMSKQQLLRMLGYDAPDETPPADRPRPRPRLFGGNSCAGAEAESGANRHQDPSNPVWATFNFQSETDPAGCEGFSSNPMKHELCRNCCNNWRCHPDSVGVATAQRCIRAGQEALPTQITNDLYLGGYLAASAHDLLQKEGITGVINTASNLHIMFHSFKEAPERFDYLHFNMEDRADQPIEDQFEACSEFIDKHVAAGGKVLSHCAQGASRSSCILIAYLMRTQQRPFDVIWSEIKELRPCTSMLNGGFCEKLRAYQSQLGING